MNTLKPIIVPIYYVNRTMITMGPHFLAWMQSASSPNISCASPEFDDVVDYMTAELNEIGFHPLFIECFARLEPPPTWSDITGIGKSD
jgi:hypothetical protein